MKKAGAIVTDCQIRLNDTIVHVDTILDDLSFLDGSPLGIKVNRYFNDPVRVNWFARFAVGLLALVCMVASARAQRPLRDPGIIQTDRDANDSRGRIRVDRNDRGTYQSATIERPAGSNRSVNRSASQSRPSIASRASGSISQVGYDAATGGEGNVVLAPPVTVQSDAEQTAARQAQFSQPVWHDGDVTDFGGHGCDAGCVCDGGSCDSHGCDSLGCDSLGCDGSCTAATMGFGKNERISFRRDRWFGSAEALLWWRDGDRLPPLVTTGPATDQDTAGELGEPGTDILFGNDNILNDLGVGGRLTIGTWLDDHQNRSIVARLWYGGQTDDQFNANSDDFAVLARPFTNFSDVDTGVADTQLINFPGVNQGNLSVDIQSDVYGGDISVRRKWKRGFLGSIDTLYGYQFTRLDEDLSIRSSAIAVDDQSPIFGSLLSLQDDFEISNEFHGAQFGLAGVIVDGCWSLNWLAKVGFGSLRRRADLSGSTTTSLGAAVATEDQGLLVRDSNSGVTEDHTFGWVPELGVELSYRRFPNYDLTVGYSLIAITDAIRVSSVIDDDLGSNLNVDGAGPARPSITLDDGTFYLQGIHFGLAKIY